MSGATTTTGAAPAPRLNAWLNTHLTMTEARP